jgi:proteasome lid subunit RPN8/RPN11
MGLMGNESGSVFGRPEMVVGWYHSHPGFGCWLSGVDINTQQVMQDCDQIGACLLRPEWDTFW